MNLNEEKNIIPQHGIRLQELISELGCTERSFAIKLGYKHPSIIYAVVKGRKISPPLMKKIRDFYHGQTGNHLNQNWLTKGENQKLLTIESGQTEPIGLEEVRVLYDKNCASCLEKDEKIEELRTELEALRKDYIECLKEVSAIKKAASG